MAEVKLVDPNTLKEWLDKDEAILIDVREPEENEEESIPGAKLIPLKSLQKSKLPNIGNKKLVFHCGVGKRGGIASEKILLEDPTLDVYNLQGGITAWKNSGLSIIKSNKRKEKG